MRKPVLAAALVLAAMLAATATASAGTRVHPTYPNPKPEVERRPCSAPESVNVANCADVLVDTDTLIDAPDDDLATR